MTLWPAPDEQGDYLIPFVPCEIAFTRVDFSIAFQIDHILGDFELRISGAFSYKSRIGAGMIDPDAHPEDLGPILRSARSGLLKGRVGSDGHLELQFGDGMLVDVPTSDEYEPWQIVSSSGLRVISMPGGQLAIWQPSQGPS